MSTKRVLKRGSGSNNSAIEKFYHKKKQKTKHLKTVSFSQAFLKALTRGNDIPFHAKCGVKSELDWAEIL